MEPSILKALADNPALFEAVKEKVLEQFDTRKTKIEGLDDKRLGEVVRADLSGMKKVEAAFKEIEKHKTPLPSHGKVNEAR